MENPGETVGRERLTTLLWGKDVHVDYEDGLNHAVKRLRDSLGDDPKRPRYIERMPVEGYRFVAEIRERPPLPVSNMRRNRLYLVAAGVAVCLVTAMAYLPGNEPGLSRTVAAADPILAVLPFQDLSGGADGELFAVGIAEALSDELSKIGGLRVTSRNSVDLVGRGGGD